MQPQGAGFMLGSLQELGDQVEANLESEEGGLGEGNGGIPGGGGGGS